ncbi:MAG: hypothetical protein LUG93_14710 [Lachnospiraceae bacterium]|nr:hypothetical protein [Lachnospiraceae bacterium]
MTSAFFRMASIYICCCACFDADVFAVVLAAELVVFLATVSVVFLVVVLVAAFAVVFVAGFRTITSVNAGGLSRLYCHSFCFGVFSL